MLILSVIDEMLATRVGSATPQEIQDLLLDIRLAVVEIAELEWPCPGAESGLDIRRDRHDAPALSR